MKWTDQAAAAMVGGTEEDQFVATSFSRPATPLEAYVTVKMNSQPGTHYGDLLDLVGPEVDNLWLSHRAASAFGLQT